MGPIETTLSCAYALIEDPKRWCQGTYARDREGVGCHERDREACAWCLKGALLREENWASACDFLDHVTSRWFEFGYQPYEVNDDLGHLPTLCLLKTAIAEARKQGV